MTYGYIRVSSDKQTVDNQRYEISTFCAAQSLKIDGWIEETISGTKTPDKRKLGALLGRPKGAVGKHTNLSGHEHVIQVLLDEGTSYAEIARIFHVDRSTLVRFCRGRAIN